MKAGKRQRLERAGWKVGTAKEFLNRRSNSLHRSLGSLAPKDGSHPA